MTTLPAVLSRPKERRPYQPFGGAITMWRSRRRECLLVGPGNTGKSRANLEKLHYCADKYPGTRMLMVRKTRKSLTQSAMVTYEQNVLPEGWLGRLIRFNTTEQQYEYPNGSILAVGGLDDPEKFQSSEWDMIYAQEATELSVNDWEILTKTLRYKHMPYQQLLADCNPSYPTHWLKQRGDRGATLMIESRHADNPAFTEEDRATLEALTGVRRLRLYLGLWAAAEGMVYEEWDSAVHKVSRKQLIEWGVLTPEGTRGVAIQRVYAACDWGFTNPGTLQTFHLDGDGRAYMVHELYRTQRTIAWWIEQAQHVKQRFGVELFICDPSEPAYIEQFRKAGLNAVEAINDIAPGIGALQARLQVKPDGKTRFYVYEDALEERDEARVAAHQPYSFEQEILEYVWPKAQDGKPVKEVPVKLNDHAMDAARYLAMWLDGPMMTASEHVVALQARLAAQQARVAPPTQGSIPPPAFASPLARPKGWWE